MDMDILTFNAVGELVQDVRDDFRADTLHLNTLAAQGDEKNINKKLKQLNRHAKAAEPPAGDQKAFVAALSKLK